MASKRRYTFTERRSSKGGKFALCLAGAAFVLLAAVVLISVFFQGNAGSFIGALSLTGALLSAYGFYCGMKSFSETDVSPAFSILGSIASGVIMVAYLTLFLTGLR